MALEPRLAPFVRQAEICKPGRRPAAGTWERSVWQPHLVSLPDPAVMVERLLHALLPA
jgi:hypothetical protein